MKNKSFLFLFLVCSTTYLTAQTPNSNYKLTNEFVNFFVGSWAGDGEFPNGKKISANLTFELTLDSSWISYEHTDKLPNRYKALSMWGVDMLSGQFVAYTFDNFHGHRKFVSDGWKDNKLILTTNEYYPQRGLLFQHFIYEKLTDKSFKMTYETSKDGITWKLGDFLVFSKK
ncbi:hypothetical protein [Fibrella aquatilis]|uniref:DUF1579 domain-containing protein n=1 Tax=Fibrella aquatilis TaxID=2817059 RepID=A0A939K1S9_9BACT|nr:hypothetical protein [Fibrella aquatilis]MBO0932575.1 hypothetical protein [Fibrella aquatilis]